MYVHRYSHACLCVQASDIKRVYNFRKALLLLDFEDESADSLKCLLVTCFIHPAYLKFEEVSFNPVNVLRLHTLMCEF